MSNGLSIRTDKGPQTALAYVFVDGKWQPCVPHVRIGGAYKPVYVPEESVEVEYAMVHSDSYRGGWNSYSDDDVRQGYAGGKRITGCMWFDNEALRAQLGKATIESATLRLFAQKRVGRGAPVDVELCGTTAEYASRTTGAPSITKTYGLIGEASPGEVTTLTVPTQAVVDLVSGTINALALYSSDKSYYDTANTYSKNYARFNGDTSSTDETRPMLTITAIKRLV